MGDTEQMTEDGLISVAWAIRECACVREGGTKVGCAILSTGGRVSQGCNIEGPWQTSLHAEVVAISKVAESGDKGTCIVIASETENFSPCGACLDWLMKFCLPNARVVAVNREGSKNLGRLRDLYPQYPRR